jgi:hypothetical protein
VAWKGCESIVLKVSGRTRLGESIIPIDAIARSETVGRTASIVQAGKPFATPLLMVLLLIEWAERVPCRDLKDPIRMPAFTPFVLGHALPAIQRSPSF